MIAFDITIKMPFSFHVLHACVCNLCLPRHGSSSICYGREGGLKELIHLAQVDLKVLKLLPKDVQCMNQNSVIIRLRIQDQSNIYTVSKTQPY